MKVTARRTTTASGWPKLTAGIEYEVMDYGSGGFAVIDDSGERREFSMRLQDEFYWRFFFKYIK